MMKVEHIWISKKEVCQILGISRSKLEYLINPAHKRYDPDFPKPRKLQKSIRFSRIEMEEYMNAITIT